MHKAQQRFPGIAKRVAEKSGLLFVDLSLPLASGNPGLMKNIVHFSNNGAKLVAQILEGPVRDSLRKREVSSLEIARQSSALNSKATLSVGNSAF